MTVIENEITKSKQQVNTKSYWQSHLQFWDVFMELPPFNIMTVFSFSYMEFIIIEKNLSSVNKPEAHSLPAKISLVSAG